MPPPCYFCPYDRRVHPLRVAAEPPLAFLAAIQNANEWLAAAPACSSYQLAHCKENAGLFIWRIEWLAAERHGFRKSAAFGTFFRLAKLFYRSIQKMHYYAVVQEK